MKALFPKSLFTCLAVTFTVSFALVFGVRAHAQQVEWTYTDIAYGSDDPARQFLNIYLAGTAEPAPVYLFAHSNGGDAYGVPQDQADTIRDAGYTLVSWESVTPINTEQDTLTAWSDAQTAFDWIRANASTYNIDPDRIVIAGRSRGSVASWQLAHSAHPAIQGIYMYNALPDRVWTFPAIWTDAVTADSPPIYMVYGPTPGDGDSHAPENAYPIRDAYTDLGIGGTFTTYDSMAANGISNINHYFPEFVESLGPEPAPANMVDNFDGGNTVYPWSESGVWYVSGGTYNQDDVIGHRAAYAGNPAWSDYTFSADMITVSSADPASGWMTSSLAFRVSDNENLYFVRLTADGKLQLRSRSGGANTLIASTQTGYSPFVWQTYKIVVLGDSIQISINDELLINTNDGDHGSGYIGIRTTQSSISVDNVAVTQPPGC